ncbi:CRISPR-associated protein Csx18 [Microcystis aeruginosa CS-555/01A07]|uniref:CRISPR-associated protein Csx18 n=1 Tax=Microcystis aeruginosa TaxID=1126 RepID=UPI00232DE793|nr:CRISPR-associated protein Csx18 [Microcystis aeruginosa]MDB9430468.1 CRISPR-associated protein Csx18 [Microcystis aeruginosa CS-555/01A07]
MYISKRSAFIRNCTVSGVNGTITLVILLIAPLGLLAVIVNTALITLSTFIVVSLGDRVVIWLWRDRLPDSIRETYRLTHREANRSIERRRDE